MRRALLQCSRQNGLIGLTEVHSHGVSLHPRHFKAAGIGDDCDAVLSGEIVTSSWLTPKSRRGLAAGEVVDVMVRGERDITTRPKRRPLGSEVCPDCLAIRDGCNIDYSVLSESFSVASGIIRALRRSVTVRASLPSTTGPSLKK